MEQKGNIGPRYAIRLGELREWHIVTARCFRCGHHARLGNDFLTWERSPHAYLADLERKLRCTRCGNRRDNTLSVSAASRN
jgi:hypothetical protein